MRFGLVVSLLLGAELACGRKGRDFPEPPAGVLDSSDAIRKGETIYLRDCSICHGIDGHGDGLQAKSLNPPPSDLRNLSGARAEPGYWFFRIKEGGKAEPFGRERSAMPAWGEHLSDADIWNLVAYLSAMTGGTT